MCLAAVAYPRFSLGAYVPSKQPELLSGCCVVGRSGSHKCCLPGHSGTIIATKSSPYYSGACEGAIVPGYFPESCRSDAENEALLLLIIMLVRWHVKYMVRMQAPHIVFAPPLAKLCHSAQYVQ